MKILLFFLIIVLMPIDGFPLGIAYFREFGARINNFFILILGIIFFISTYQKKNTFKLDVIKILLLLLTVVLSINVILVLNKDYNLILHRTPFIQWFVQYMMYLWFLFSFIIYKIFFLKNKELIYNGKLHKMYISSAIISILFFLYHYACNNGLFTSSTFFEFLRGPVDIFRASGLSTEPSLYGAWVVWIWPLIYFYKKSLLVNILIFFLFLTAILSGSRTFLAIIFIQFIIILLVYNNRIFTFKNLFIGLVIILLFYFSLDKLVSIGNIHNNLSSIARIGSTITAINVFTDYFFTGIGIGQFSAYFGDYMPEFAHVSKEILAWGNQDTTSRASTFNLFLRFGAEGGIVPFIIFLSINIILIKKIFKYIKKYKDKIMLGYLLSAIGGISFWLSQDQFGYQPAIFGLATLYYFYTTHYKISYRRKN